MNFDEQTAQPFSFGFLSEVYRCRLSLDQRHELFEEVESLYIAKSAELVAEYEAQEESGDSDQAEARADYLAMGIRYLEEELPGIHRSATFIMLYHFLEATLDEVCVGIGAETKSDVKLEHLKGTGIERAFLFLSLIGKLDLSLVEKDVQFIKACRRLRNCVVHAGGVANQQVLGFLAAEPSLAGQGGPEVVITQDFVLKFIESLHNLFDGIHDAMQDFMRRSGNTGNVYFLGALGYAPMYGPDPKNPKPARPQTT